MAFFPASGLIRDLSLSLMVAAILFSAEFLILLLYEWAKSLRRIDDARFAWSIFMAALIAQLSSFIISDFYAPSWEREFWLKMGYFSILSGLTGFTSIVERKILPTRGVFTLIGPVGILIILIFPHFIFKYVSYFFFYPAYSVFFILLFRSLQGKAGELLSMQINLFVAGFILFLSGYALTSDLFVQLSGGLSYLVGSVLMTASIIAVNFAVLRMPSFGELDWDAKVKELYLISSTGVPLLYVNFETGTSTVDPDQALTAAVLSALSLGLKRTGKGGRVRVVDQGNLKFLFGYAGNATLVVVATEDLYIIRRRIDEFMQTFATLYGEILEAWDGNISVFRPAEALARSIFTRTDRRRRGGERRSG